MAKRMSITLEREDEAAVDAFAAPGTAENAAMLEWLQEHGDDSGLIGSEAALLRTLMRAGAEALRDRVLDLAYPELAVVLGGEVRSESRGARQRYADRTDAIVDA